MNLQNLEQVRTLANKRQRWVRYRNHLGTSISGLSVHWYDAKDPNKSGSVSFSVPGYGGSDVLFEDVPTLRTLLLAAIDAELASIDAELATLGVTP